MVKYRGDRLYVTRLRCLLRTSECDIVTKEGMKENCYDNELLKFLFQVKPENFQGFTAVKSKFEELLKKEEDKQTLLQAVNIFALRLPDVRPTSYQQLFLSFEKVYSNYKQSMQ